MSESQCCAVADALQPSSAVLLCNKPTSREDRNLTKVLEFFGIAWKTVEGCNGGVQEPKGRYVILSSADCMAAVMQDTQGSPKALPSWIKQARSVFVYGFRNDDASTKLVRFLTGDPEAKVRPIRMPKTIMAVTETFPEMCGPMSGMRVPVTLRAPECVCDVRLALEGFQSVVRADDGEVFFGVTFRGVPFYISTCETTLDISALSDSYFDVKKCFCEVAPLVLFLKIAFPDAFSGQGETSACLIVDDPPLKYRYGFLDFREAVDLMGKHNFTTTIAFIPWNWRRTDPRTLSLFQSRPERLSLVVHGCDHTAGEFAERCPVLLDRKIRTSGQRMEWFRRSTSIEVDHVMVFPQGKFSPESGRALKVNGFVAAVNTEVAPAEPAVNETTIADLWNVAIMRYGSFPIFTRRYPDHGIENFAFDALLGKPCLIAAHHDAFRDHARNLVDLVVRLNSLRWNLVWRSLGAAVSRSFRTRRFDDGTEVIRMFAGSLTAENRDAELRRRLLLKEEADPDCVQAVWVNQTPVEFSFENGQMQAYTTTPPGATAVIRILYRNDLEPIPDRDGARTKIKVAVKRYLSEFRDNYLSRNDFLCQSANRLKQLMG
jgi:hypothetical protein